MISYSTFHTSRSWFSGESSGGDVSLLPNHNIDITDITYYYYNNKFIARDPDAGQPGPSKKVRCVTEHNIMCNKPCLFGLWNTMVFFILSRSVHDPARHSILISCGNRSRPCSRTGISEKTSVTHRVQRTTCLLCGRRYNNNIM